MIKVPHWLIDAVSFWLLYWDDVENGTMPQGSWGYIGESGRLQRWAFWQNRTIAGGRLLLQTGVDIFHQVCRLPPWALKKRAEATEERLRRPLGNVGMLNRAGDCRAPQWKRKKWVGALWDVEKKWDCIMEMFSNYHFGRLLWGDREKICLHRIQATTAMVELLKMGCCLQNVLKVNIDGENKFRKFNCWKCCYAMGKWEFNKRGESQEGVSVDN